MSDYIKILICPKCHSILNDKDLVYHHEKNGLIYVCVCKTYYTIGLAVIGSDAVRDCLDMLNDTGD